MSVKFDKIIVPDRGYVNRLLDIYISTHAESDVKNMGIALCYIGDGDMYLRVPGSAEEFSVPRCIRVRVLWYRGSHSKCTTRAFPLQLRYTRAGSATLIVFAGYIVEEIKEFRYTDVRSATILFAPALEIGLRDLLILAPMVAVPTGIGVVTRRAGLGIGIGIAAAGAYLGYRLYKYYKA